MSRMIWPRQAARSRFTDRDRDRIEKTPGVIKHERDPSEPPPRLRPAISVTTPIRFEDLVPERDSDEHRE